MSLTNPKHLLSISNRFSECDAMHGEASSRIASCWPSQRGTSLGACQTHSASFFPPVSCRSMFSPLKGVMHGPCVVISGFVNHDTSPGSKPAAWSEGSAMKLLSYRASSIARRTSYSVERTTKCCCRTCSLPEALTAGRRPSQPATGLYTEAEALVTHEPQPSLIPFISNSTVSR